MRLCLCLLAVCVLPPLTAKDMIRTPLDVPMLGELEEYLAQNLLFNQKNRDANLGDINQQPGFKALIRKHGLKLFGGPVIGLMDMADQAAAVGGITDGTRLAGRRVAGRQGSIQRLGHGPGERLEAGPIGEVDAP